MKAGREKLKHSLWIRELYQRGDNIYACEILYRARVNPERIAATVMEDDCKRVFCHAGERLKAAIKKRGTSIADWRDLYACIGDNPCELKVYGWERNLLLMRKRHSPDKIRLT